MQDPFYEPAWDLEIDVVKGSAPKSQAFDKLTTDVDSSIDMSSPNTNHENIEAVAAEKVHDSQSKEIIDSPSIITSISKTESGTAPNHVVSSSQVSVGVKSGSPEFISICPEIENYLRGFRLYFSFVCLLLSSILCNS